VKHELVATAVEHWKEVAAAMPAWGKVKAGNLKAMERRQLSRSSLGTVTGAAGTRKISDSRNKSLANLFGYC